jgi:hypothetical protein
MGQRLGFRSGPSAGVADSDSIRHGRRCSSSSEPWLMPVIIMITAALTVTHDVCCCPNHRDRPRCVTGRDGHDSARESRSSTVPASESGEPRDGHRRPSRHNWYNIIRVNGDHDDHDQARCPAPCLPPVPGPATRRPPGPGIVDGDHVYCQQNLNTTRDKTRTIARGRSLAGVRGRGEDPNPRIT